MRRKILHVHPEYLVHVLCGRMGTFATDAPDDLKFVDVWFDGEQCCVEVLCESDSFDVATNATEYPIFNMVCRRLEAN